MTQGARQETPAREVTSSGPLHDVRAVVVAIVVGASIVSPTFGLRGGAVVCGLLAVGAFLSNWRPERLDWIALALCALAMTSRVWTIDPESTQLSSLNLVGAVAVFLGVRVSIVSVRHAMIVAYGFAAGAVWAAWSLIDLSDEVRFRFDTTALRQSVNVETGASTNYLAYAFVCCMALVALILATRGATFFRVLLAAAVIVACWLGIVQTGTRGALVGIGLIIFWLIGWRTIPRASAILFAVGVVALNASIVTGVASDRLSALSGARSRDTGTLNGRLDVWPQARQEIMAHPFLGQGSGTFKQLNEIEAAAHNALLDFGAGLGVGAMLLFVGLIWLAFAPAWKAGGRRLLAAGFMVAALTPALSTGFWIEAAPMWAVLALITFLGSEDAVPLETRPEKVRRRPPARRGA